jgi:hypothetical protein
LLHSHCNHQHREQRETLRDTALKNYGRTRAENACKCTVWLRQFFNLDSISISRPRYHVTALDLQPSLALLLLPVAANSCCACHHLLAALLPYLLLLLLHQAAATASAASAAAAARATYACTAALS